MMKPRLDAGSPFSLRASWPRQSIASTCHRPTLLPSSLSGGRHSVRALTCPLAQGFSARALSTTTTTRAAAVPKPSSRRARWATLSRHRPLSVAAPRALVPPRRPFAPTASEAVVLGQDRTPQVAGAQPPMSSASPSQSPALVPPSLQHSSAAESCPLLYSSVVCSFLQEALSSHPCCRTPDGAAQLTRLAKEMPSSLAGDLHFPSKKAVADASYAQVTYPFALLLCQVLRRRGDAAAEALVLCGLRQALGSGDGEMERVVGAMVAALLSFWWRQRATLSTVHVESALRSLLDVVSDSLLPALLESLQVRRRAVGADSAAANLVDRVAPHCSQAACDVRGARRWHPVLSEAAVLLCLRRAQHALVGGKEKGRPHPSSLPGIGSSSVSGAGKAELTAEQCHRLRLCCVCQLAAQESDRTRHDCAVATMSALKGADLHVLVAVYDYYVDEGLASVHVARRFLPDCGMCVPHVTQRGIALSAYLAALRCQLQSRLPRSSLPHGGGGALVASLETLRPLLHARATLLDSGWEPSQVEAGLVHVNSVLTALGCAGEVRGFYAKHRAGLRETPHSVMACVCLGDVDGAVGALAELGASRPEGWTTVPPAVSECMAAVSRLVGASGAPSHVDALYEALSGFHNGALFTSQFIEVVFAGVCDRIRDVQVALEDGTAAPREVLARVIPIVRATLRYVGDEINADMMLELVEAALHVDAYAVPLTAALIWAFRTWMDLSLCLQELLCRVDASTQNIPFLQYYALCYARDTGRMVTFDHLCALWQVDGDAIWHRAAHLCAPCQLWRCAACGRLNSDRYNYCLCSALRYSHVVCGTCGYAQDERLRQCLSCGTPLLSTAALAGAMPRKAWRCGDCGARNPAKLTLLCFRCGSRSGPRFALLSGGSGGAAPSAVESFCACATAPASGQTAAVARRQAGAAAYTAAVGVCRTCGRFKMDHAAQHSGVWVCVGCQQRRSTLERICPSCPQVECLPHAVSREPIGQPRVCRHCRHAEANPFTVVCAACGSANRPFDSCVDTAAALKAGGDAAVEPAPADGNVPSHGGSEGTGSAALWWWCFHCQEAQPFRAGATARQTCCRSCGAPCEERGLCALPPRTCPRCRTPLPAQHPGTAVCPTCAAYVEPSPQPGLHASATAMDGARAEAGPAVLWNAVTVLHTCEVLDGCCVREARRAEGTESSSSSSREKGLLAPETTHTRSDATLTFLQLRPPLEQTLLRLLHEWTDAESELRPSAWLPMRMDVVTVLGRALNRLRPHHAYSLTTRRLAALLKAILAHVDHQCGVAAPAMGEESSGASSRFGAHTHFTVEERCHLCLGSHPEELCAFQETVSSSSSTSRSGSHGDGDGGWICEECGSGNGNGDVCRYVCSACLALRPCVQDLLVATCWECRHCLRANVSFERYCVHCGLERAHWTPDLLPDTTNTKTASGMATKRDAVPAMPVEAKEREETEEEEGVCVPAIADAQEGSGAGQLACPPRDDEIPFTPAKCHLCGLVYIEARCPLCQNHIPDVADATGTVCEVQARHAFIQPVGTTRVQDRIFVDETLLRRHTLREGLEVRYVAELGARGRMHATFLKR